MHEIIASGAIGHVHTVYGTATGWTLHMLSHLVDYTSWFNGYEPAEWVMGQAAGRGKLTDVHASPDYVAGVVHFRNGVRGVYDCGAGRAGCAGGAVLVAQVPHRRAGHEGFAEVLTGGGWRAVTKTVSQSGPGGMDYDHDMAPYVRGDGRLAGRRTTSRIRSIRARVPRLRDRLWPLSHR